MGSGPPVFHYPSEYLPGMFFLDRSLKLYPSAYIISFIILVVFYLVLVAFWASGILGHRLFDIKHISKVTQIIIVTSQACAIILLTGCISTVQAIVSDRIVRRRTCFDIVM